MTDGATRDDGTDPPPAGPGEWLAAVQASDLPEDVKATARALAAHADPDGTLPPEVLGALDQDGRR